MEFRGERERERKTEQRRVKRVRRESAQKVQGVSGYLEFAVNNVDVPFSVSTHKSSMSTCTADNLKLR